MYGLNSVRKKHLVTPDELDLEADANVDKLEDSANLLTLQLLIQIHLKCFKQPKYF